MTTEARARYRISNGLALLENGFEEARQGFQDLRIGYEMMRTLYGTSEPDGAGIDAARLSPCARNGQGRSDGIQ